MRRVNWLLILVLSIVTTLSLVDVKSWAKEPVRLSLKEAITQAWKASDAVRLAGATLDKSSEQRKYAGELAGSFIPAPGANQSPMTDVNWVGLLKADANEQIAERDLISKRESVALEVYQKYFAVLSAQTAVAKAKAAVARDRTGMQVAWAVYRTGCGTRTQLAMAEAKVEGSEKGLSAAQEALDKAYVALNRLVGLRAEERPEIVEELSVSPLKISSLDVEVDRAVNSSVDIFKLEMLKKMAEWDLNYPLSVDLYGQAVYRNFNVQKHEVNIADLNLASAREALRERVRTTYHDIRALEQQEAALAASVATVSDALRIVQVQHKVGLVARDKVREAEAALADAEASLKSMKCQHASLLATWRYLTGKPVATL